MSNNNDMNVAIHFTTAGGQVVVKDVTSISQVSAQAAQQLEHVGTAGAKAKTGLDATAAGASDANQYATLLKASLASLVGGFSALQLIDVGDDWGQMASRIKQATESSAEYDYVQQRMISSANDTYRAITEAKEGFISMSPILRDINYSLGESISIVDSFSALLVTNATTVDRAAAAQDALSKAIQTNRFESDGWQTIVAAMPTILDNLTAATGKSGAEIRKLGIDGKLSVTEFTNALLQNKDKNLAAVKEMPTTVRDAVQGITNVLQELLGQQNEVLGVTASLAGGLVDVSDALYSVTTQDFDDLTPQLQALVQTAELLITIVGVAGAAAFLKYAGSQYLVFQNALLMNTQSVRTVSALGLVTTTAGTSTVALNALAMAQRLVLGPVGLLVGVLGTAAVAFSIYEDAAEEVKKKNDELAASFERMSNQAKAATYQDASRQLNELAGQIEAAQAKVDAARSKTTVNMSQFGGVGNPVASAEMAAATLVLNQLNAKKAELNTVIESLNKNFNAGLPALDDYSDRLTNNSSSTTAFKDELLKLYNQQKLNAEAIGATGAALTGIDLELFKAQFVDATNLPENAAAAIKAYAEQYKVATATLNLDEHLKQLEQELGLLDVRLQKGEQEYELQKALAQFTGVSPERLKAAENELRLLEKKKLAVTGKETLDALKQETELLGIRLTQGAKEYEVQKALYQLKGGDPAMLQAIEAQVRAQQLLNEQITITEEITSGAFNEYLEGITAIQTAADGAGQVIVEAFGRVAQQLNEMTKGQVEYAKQLDQLEKKKAAVDRLKDSAIKTKALTDIEREKGRLETENYQSQIGHFASITGAAKSMFSEQSKGRQALHRMEMTFSAIELAMSIQRTAANALEAITSAFAAPFPVNFASGAAMIAIMAGLGVFTGSSSGGPSAADRQESQGTGTVLGDSSAKSDSIANSLERIESLELDQYSELRSINTSIRALNAGIAQLAINLVASYGKFDEGNYQGDLGKDYKVQLGSTAGALVLGGVIGAAVDNMLGGLLGGITNKVLGGLFGSTKKELVDSGISFAAQQLGDILSSGLVKATLYDTIKVTKKKAFGLSKSTRENTEYRTLDEDIRAEFGRVFSYIGNSVTDAVKLLGLTTTKDLENFVIKLPNVSFKDLSGEEIEKELQAIFSAQGDLMAKYLVPGIAEFQQMGEGLYDTLIRVAQEQAVFNAGLASLGLELSRFGNVSKQTQIQIAQSLIELMGGIEEFSSATSDYFSAFYSESEQMAYMQKVINEQFKSLGVNLPKSRDGFKDLVDGLDLTTESGQAMFAALMKLVPMMDEFYDAAEDAADAAKKAADEEKKLSAERSKYNASVRSDIMRMGMSPLQIALDDINKWYTEATAEAKALGADTSLLTTLYSKKREALATEYVSKSIESAEAAMTALVADYQRSVEQLGQTLASVLESIAGMSDSIRGDILNIRKTLPEFDSVAYYSGEVNSLSAQLGTGTATAQLDIIGKLKASMLERYNAELAAIGTNMSALQAEQDAKQDLYETQLEQFESLKEAALSLKNAAASLLYSDLSTLTAGERLQQLQSQYNSAVTKARGGDAEAYAQVQSLGEQLLQMSKDYNPAAYNGVFDSVLAVFNELGNKTFAVPTAPAPHPAVAAFEAEKIALARRTIEQLEALTGKTEALNAVANTEYTAAVNALKAQFSVDSNKISLTLQNELAAVRAVMPRETDRVVSKMQEQITAIFSLRDGILGAIKQPPVSEVIIKNPVVLPPEFIGIGKPIHDILPILPPYLRDIKTIARDVSLDQITAMRALEDRLHTSNVSLSAIARADFVSKPLIIPPAQVAVNVDMVSVVTELRVMQRQQQQQLDQQSAIAQQTNQKLAEVVDSSKKLQVELSEFSNQAINLARVS